MNFLTLFLAELKYSCVGNLMASTAVAVAVLYLNVEINIMASCLARSFPDATFRCDELFELLGIGHRRGHISARLSSKEQQRVALGRALMSRPKVLIPDEPTGNLDRDNTHHLLSLLREYVDERGLVLLATHEPEVAALADETYGFKDGVITKAERMIG